MLAKQPGFAFLDFGLKGSGCDRFTEIKNVQAQNRQKMQVLYYGSSSFVCN